MDVLDFLVKKDKETMTAFYYPKNPRSIEDGRIPFAYERVDHRRINFATITPNLRSDEETYTIRTNDDCGFKIGKYVSTQDGCMWVIREIMHDEQAQGSEEALLYFKKVVDSVFTIRMVRAENPWGIDE